MGPTSPLACQPCWRVVFALAWVGVTALMLLPAPPDAIDTGWDKLNHALAFAALAFSASAGWPARRRLAAAGLVVWGIGLEGLQSLTPPRVPDPWDALANAVGVAAGALIFLAWVRAFSARRASA